MPNIEKIGSNANFLQIFHDGQHFCCELTYDKCSCLMFWISNKLILFVFVFADFTLLCFVTMATTFNPCFPVVLPVSSVGFAFALKLHFLGFFKFLLWVVFVDCIGVGLVIASLCW